MGYLLYQKDYFNATLAQFQAHLRNELTGCCPERVIKAASYCFEQWKKEREMNLKRLQANSGLRESNKRMSKAKPEHREVEELHKQLLAAQAKIKQLEQLRDEVIAANKEFAEEVERLEDECEEWAEGHKSWREKANEWALRSCDEYNKAERLRAENQQLKQQIAIQAVSVPQLPAGAFTIHPN
jgi:DNA repair exonuclease SbcCD ATPase subunit